jgi:hypothetical protein
VTRAETTSITCGVPTPMTRVMGAVGQPILVDRIVYATITIMSVLIIYDGWQHLKVVDVIAVIVGRVVAMFIAHVFRLHWPSKSTSDEHLLGMIALLS